MSIIDGKKPISEKKSGQSEVIRSFFMGDMHVDSDIKEALKEAGYDLRFIEARLYAEKGNYHKRMWEVFNKSHPAYDKAKEAYGKISSRTFESSFAPDGTIKRGDSVLAVRLLTLSEQHKAELKFRSAQSEGRGSQAQAAAELREAAARAGMKDKITVIEGYDNN